MYLMMKPISLCILFLLTILAVCCPVLTLEAQIFRQNQSAQQVQQRQADEQLANQFYQLQEWEKAAPMYKKLYQEYSLPHYFQFYLNCLIEMRDYKEAEKALKQYQRKGQQDVQSDIDLGYIYQLSGESAKARKVFEEVIQGINQDVNRTYQIANAFRNRFQYEYAIRVYETAARLMGKQEHPFNIEMALIYQLTGQYESMFDKYLDQLGLNPSQANMIRSRVQNVLVMDVEGSLSELFRTRLLMRVQANPSNLTFAEMLVWYSLQQKDFDMAMIQVQALDRRLGDRDHQVMELADICLSNGQYDLALDGYNYLVRKGRNSMFYAQALRGQIGTRFQLATETGESRRAIFETLDKDIDQAVAQIGFNRETYDISLIQARIRAFHLNAYADAVAQVKRVMELQLSPVELGDAKLVLADLMLFGNEVWEATLLYSQVDKSLKDAPLAHEARFRNARLRFYIGEFGWAQSQLKVLKSATSKLIANDALSLSLLIDDNLTQDSSGKALRVFAKAELLVVQRKENEALHLLDSLSSAPGAILMADHILMAKARISLQLGRNTEADSLFAIVTQLYPKSYLADDALYKRALLNENQLSNTAIARQCYEQLFMNYPASIYVAEARRKYRLLRGDTV
jgi:tetratricopeptide (TPR) repeat protein